MKNGNGEKKSKELSKPKIQYLNIHKSIEFLQQIRLVKHKIHVLEDKKKLSA